MQLQQDNIFFGVQNDVKEILNSTPDLSSIGFLAENQRDIETQITKKLKQQGICGIVLVEKATYLGIDSGIDTAWQIDDLVVQVVENAVVNRASNNQKFIGTAQDIAAKVSQVLGGAEYGRQSTFGLKTFETGEEEGLIVSKVTFQCYVRTDLSADAGNT